METLSLKDPNVPAVAIQLAARSQGLDAFSPKLSNAIESDAPTAAQINSLINRLSYLGFDTITVDHNETGPFYPMGYGVLGKNPR